MICNSCQHSVGYGVGAQGIRGPTFSSPTKSSRLLLEMDLAEGRLNSLLGSHPPISWLPPWPFAQPWELESVTQVQEGTGVGVQ